MPYGNVLKSQQYCSWRPVKEKKSDGRFVTRRFHTPPTRPFSDQSTPNLKDFLATWWVAGTTTSVESPVPSRDQRTKFWSGEQARGGTAVVLKSCIAQNLR